MTYFTMGIGVLLLVVVFLLARGGLRESGRIVLPVGQTDSVGSGEGEPSSSLNIVSITPDTVQPAIHTLSRPASYVRVQMVETFWSGGSGKSVSQVSVSGGRTRIDTQLADGGIRHELVNGTTAAVWYDEEETWTILRAEQFNADLAQRMLTYETVRNLPAEDIAEADYRELEGVSCIYVATRESEDGYAARYWVSVENGLLKAAERTCDGSVIYRFTASELAADPPEDELFLLPDGSVLESVES